MTRAIRSRISHAIRQVKETWTEVDYAQRRLLEIQIRRADNSSHPRNRISPGASTSSSRYSRSDATVRFV